MAHWVKIGLQASGQRTGYGELDLEKVYHVQVTYDPDEVVGLAYNRAGRPENWRFEGESAKQFLEAWNAFRGEYKYKGEVPEAESDIHIVGMAPVNTMRNG